MVFIAIPCNELRDTRWPRGDAGETEIVVKFFGPFAC
jgi:hypothetical protein